jgi:hypothetical protein
MGSVDNSPLDVVGLRAYAEVKANPGRVLPRDWTSRRERFQSALVRLAFEVPLVTTLTYVYLYSKYRGGGDGTAETFIFLSLFPICGALLAFARAERILYAIVLAWLFFCLLLPPVLIQPPVAK